MIGLPALPPLTHPLTEPGGLPVAPALAALYAAAVLFVIVYAVPKRPLAPGGPGRLLDPWRGALTPPQRAGRILGVIGLVLAVLVARLGAESELENIVPALVVGVGWPALLLLCALGLSWRWVDPLDGIARLFDRASIPAPPADVGWAALSATAVAWYLAVPVEGLSPRSLGIAIAVYALVMVAGALYFGRAWLGRADVFGLLFSWLPRIARGRLVGWDAPLNADLVVGVLTGGFLFGAIRRSELWGELNSADAATLYATVGFVFCCAITAAIVTRGERWARRHRAQGAVIVAMVPAVASIAIALALARNRFLVSLQLLPALTSDPLGRGWDLFGTAERAIDPNPLGTTGLVVTQVVVLLLGHYVGAYVSSRRSTAPAKAASATVLSLSLAVSVMAVTAVSALPAAP